MKVTIKYAVLRAQLNRLGRAVAKGKRAKNMPIIGCVRLEASATGLAISGTDLRVGMVITMLGQVQAVGVVAINYKELVAALGGLRGVAEVDLWAGPDHSLVIRTAEVLRVEVGGYDAEEFPLLPEPASLVATFTASDLAATLRATCFSSALYGDEVYCERFGGLLFDFGRGKTQPELLGAVQVVATDGFRLTHDWLPYQPGDRTVDRLTIRGDSLNVLMGVLPQQSLLVTCQLNERGSWAMFAWQHGGCSTRVSGGVLDTAHPFTNQLVPQGGSTSLLLPVASTLAALQAVAKEEASEQGTIRLDIDPSTGVTVQSFPPLGEVVPTTIPSLQVAGLKLKIGFSLDYLLEVLQACAALGMEEVKLQLRGRTEPGVFRSETRPGFSHTLMPYHLPTTWGF